VLSPSDFGVRTDPPANPALLDELAAELWHAGWSLKALHRALVTSSTYRQASLDRPECRRVDPENRLWWRMHRRRLELEPMRDTLLAVAGQLDLAMYGRPVELTKPPFSRRRAVYGFIDRQDLPGMFRVFDIASPDQSSPRRPRTTVPQQALFFMNSPLVVEQAKALASRPEVTSAGSDDERIAALYRLVLLRQPDPEEGGDQPGAFSRRRPDARRGRAPFALGNPRSDLAVDKRAALHRLKGLVHGPDTSATACAGRDRCARAPVESQAVRPFQTAPDMPKIVRPWGRASVAAGSGACRDRGLVAGRAWPGHVSSSQPRSGPLLGNPRRASGWATDAAGGSSRECRHRSVRAIAVRKEDWPFGRRQV